MTEHVAPNLALKRSINGNGVKSRIGARSLKCWRASRISGPRSDVKLTRALPQFSRLDRSRISDLYVHGSFPQLFDGAIYRGLIRRVWPTRAICPFFLAHVPMKSDPHRTAG